jgi:hypothetical protein
VALTLGVPYLICLYAFIYKHKKLVLSKQFWQVIFWLSIIIDGFFISYYAALKELMPALLNFGLYPVSEVIGGIILRLPIFYALYQLVYNPKWYLNLGKEKS